MLLRTASIAGGKATVDIEYVEQTGAIVGVQVFNSTDAPVWVQVRHHETDEVVVDQTFPPSMMRGAASRAQVDVPGLKLGSIRRVERQTDPSLGRGPETHTEGPHVATRWPA